MPKRQQQNYCLCPTLYKPLKVKEINKAMLEIALGVGIMRKGVLPDLKTVAFGLINIPLRERSFILSHLGHFPHIAVFENIKSSKLCMEHLPLSLSPSDGIL